MPRPAGALGKGRLIPGGPTGRYLTVIGQLVVTCSAPRSAHVRAAERARFSRKRGRVQKRSGLPLVVQRAPRSNTRESSVSPRSGRPPGAARREWLIRRYSAPIGALNATLDRTFFALSDPTRRGILERLGRGPATIGELAEPFGLTINGVKKHVGILEEVDLVATEKVGRARECQLGPAQLEDATSWIDDYRSTWESRLDRFGSYVEENHPGR